ncbi:hypothetical protein L484_024062 [Morus notabilis]|uniref:Uncharacterized protein n=1 Tax=Morus notabilis TaxID=981085 RepID=W9RPZ5_9ROSA|nr:hypothetical protein L484_024062 [Morus notabilis]
MIEASEGLVYTRKREAWGRGGDVGAGGSSNDCEERECRGRRGKRKRTIVCANSYVGPTCN